MSTAESKSNVVAICPHCGSVTAWAATDCYTSERELRREIGQWVRRGDEVRYWTEAEFLAFRDNKAVPFGCQCGKTKPATPHPVLPGLE